MGYKIGSFNLRNIGKTALGKLNLRSIETIAKIISEENFDIVTLQEVLSEGAALSSNFGSKETMKKDLLYELGSNWSFAWADSRREPGVSNMYGFSNNDQRGEGYAFIWNNTRIQLAKTSNGRADWDFEPRMIDRCKQDLFRKPFYGRFVPKADPSMELRLVCVHTYYGKTDNAADRKVRQHEIDVLLKDIYPEIADRRYGYNLPAYTIVLGDYNAELWNSNSLKWQSELKKLRSGKIPAVMQTDLNGEVVSTRYDNRRIKTVQEGLTTLKSKMDEKGDEDFDTAGYSFNYDHFSYEQAMFDDVKISYRRLTEAVTKYCKINNNDVYQNDFEKYYKTVSDHIPIEMNVEFN